MEWKVERGEEFLVTENVKFPHLSLWCNLNDNSRDKPVTAVCKFCGDRTDLKPSENPAKGLLTWTAVHKKCKGTHD